MSNRHIFVLTNCTHRKRGPSSIHLTARSLPTSTYAEVSKEWAKRVEAAPPHSPAGRLYCGRAITETLDAARVLEADVAFVSAGLGVVSREENVPTYSLTTSPGVADSIGERITEAFLPSTWWDSLLVARGQIGKLKRLVKAEAPDLTLIVLPSTYLQLIHQELETLPLPMQQSLRIIGPRRETEVPEGLRSQWLPYDDRLDNPKSGINGTTADFPHRAMRHFANLLLQHPRSRSVETHREHVQAALQPLRPYVRRRGASASDDQVLEVIRGLWEKCGRNRSRVLRELRDRSGIACEQSRFRRLADQFVASVES